MHNFIDGMSNLKIYSIDDFEWDKNDNILIPKIDLHINLMHIGATLQNVNELFHRVVITGKKKTIAFIRRQRVGLIPSPKMMSKRASSYIYRTSSLMFPAQTYLLWCREDSRYLPWIDIEKKCGDYPGLVLLE